MTYLTGNGFVPRLDALANRLAKDVIAGTYANAREAAKANVVEYAGHDTQDKEQRNAEVGNLSRRIVASLSKSGFDKFGSELRAE